MIGGQTADALAESREPTLELARHIHEHQTASVFQAACRLGALATRRIRDEIAAL